ncbi:hypothetical protein FGJ01_07590 [Hydrogenophaga intermedia]|nr:hypothetical protein FGJ01_07590 [Hydrogenophaga intermedia]
MDGNARSPGSNSTAWVDRDTPAALRASPARGRHLRPGKAGSAVSLGSTTRAPQVFYRVTEY